jgi:hypothetical protein
MYSSQQNVNTSPLDNYQSYFDIDMYYCKTLSNQKKAKRKDEIAISLAARFGFVSATVLTDVFDIQRHKVFECLNRLVQRSLLSKVKTSRANDGVVWVLTYSGAKYAEDIMRHEVFFRSTTNPILQLNQNSIMHDAILQFVLMKGVQNKIQGQSSPLWRGFVTEKEFKRIYPTNQVKNVDAVVINNDGSLAAIEMEGSYKNKGKVEATLLKLKSNMLCQHPLFDKVYFVGSSNKVFEDTKRFQTQLLTELPNRYNKKTKAPYLTVDESEQLKTKLIFRTKFTDVINQQFYT